MSCQRDQEVIRALRQQGYRLTAQRRTVLEAVVHGQGHATAEDIFARARGGHPGLNRSTVYRTLEFLVGLGLVAGADLGEGRVRYHFREQGRHHHLVCQGCGAVEEMGEKAMAPLRDALLRERGFEADLSHLALFGRCSACRAEGSGVGAERRGGDGA